MTKEDKVIEQMLVRFPFMENKLFSPRSGRVITPPLRCNHFEDAFEFVTTDVGFDTLHQIIGIDNGADLGFIYILSNPDQIVLLLKLIVPKSNPEINSVTARFPNALLYEQELANLWGAIIKNLPEANSTYPLTADWPPGNYPLRKEWKVEYFNPQTQTYNPPPYTVKEGWHG